MIGLGVMGQNLTLNIERNGYSVAVWDREPAVLEKFITGVAGKNIIGTATPEALVKSLETPRKIILLVKAGAPVDWTINLIRPYLEPGDTIIDGGNSHFKETERRQKELLTNGVFMIGSGCLGWREGRVAGSQPDARWGSASLRTASSNLGSDCGEGPDGPCVTYIGRAARAIS